MENTNDIEIYRKKRKRKRRRKRLITFAIILLLLFGIALAFAYFQNMDLLQAVNSESNNSSKQVSEGFPIKLAGEKAKDVGYMGGQVTFLGETNFAIYTDGGKNLLTSPHGYTNPVVKSVSKRSLIYDQGGNGFKIESKNETLFKKTIAEKIVFGAISEDGYVAIVKQVDRYASCVTIYDPMLNEIYKWSSAQNQIVALDINKNNKGCVLVAVGASEGEMYSNIISLDFSKEQEVFTTELDGTVGISISIKSSSTIGIIGDNAAYSLNAKGEIIGKYEYNKKLVYFSNMPTKDMVVILSDVAKRENNYIVVLDSMAQTRYTYELEEKINDIECDGSRLLLLASEKIYDFDMSLKLINTIKCTSDAKKMAFIGSNVYILSSKDIVKAHVE
ncbi:MAG: hypothetical protein K0R90_368 [Oscillospiraceae bacterium]|nr:hypothetical protein [Oscillospiraceae bacterium]